MTECPLAKTGRYARIYLLLKNIWRIINIKEGSCNIIYKINLTGMSILFSNKGMGCQRLPIGLSSIIYWAKKNQNCRQPRLDSSSGQIYWVISYHRYYQEVGMQAMGEIIDWRELQDVGDLLSKVDKLNKTTASLVQKR